MAFGKDAAQLANVGTFRQQAAAYAAATKRENKGGGSIPLFIDRYQPSKVDVDLVRLIPSSYTVQTAISKDQLMTRQLVFFPFSEHFDGHLKTGTVCSAGPFAQFKGKGAPCRGCEIFWSTMAQDANGRMKRGNRMSYREMFAFTVIHFAPYAKVPQVDQATGQVKTNDKGEPYYNWTRVLAHEKAKYVGIETKQAHRMHWPMGTQHYNTLWSYDKEIGKSCATCQGRNKITSLAWVCSSCGDAIIETDSTTLPPDEVDKLTMGQAKCPRCSYEGFLTEIFECANCTPAGTDPKRATLFDVDLSVKRIESGDGKSNMTTLMISGWSDPHPLDPMFQDINKPMALDKIYAPTPMDVQVSKLGAAAPPRTPVTGATPYPGR